MDEVGAVEPLPPADPWCLLDGAAVLIVHLEPTGRVRWVNRTFEQRTRWSGAEVIGREPTATFLAGRAPGPRARGTDARLGQPDAGALAPVLRTRGGGELRVEWHTSPLHDAAGRALGRIAVGVEVTPCCEVERARAEREPDARRTHAVLSDAQRIAQIGSWELDVASDELVWSEEIFRIFELDATRFGASYQAFLEAIHPEDRQVVDGAYTTAREHRTPYDIVHRLQMPDGRIKWVHERCETIYDAEGRALRSIGTVQDVTSRVIAEQAAALHTAAIESSINAIAFADLEGRLTYVNQSFVSLWGYAQRDDVVGRNASELWSDPRGAGAVLGTDVDEAWSGEVTACRADRTVRVLQASTHLVRDVFGRPAALMASFIDLSARIEAERQLATRLREKEVLLREIHHRVKNNLQIISSLLHFEAKKHGARATPQAFAELRERLLAMTLVHEKLYQAKDLALIDFSDYARSLVRALTATVGHAHAVRVETTADAIALPIELALPAGMIICELVTNVLKYAFPDGRDGVAAVSARRCGERVILTVADDGIGFPDGFELRDERSFGLALVRALVAQLAGEITATNRGGAHVVVSFPAPAPTPASAPSPRGADHV